MSRRRCRSGVARRSPGSGRRSRSVARGRPRTRRAAGRRSARAGSATFSWATWNVSLMVEPRGELVETVDRRDGGRPSCSAGLRISSDAHDAEPERGGTGAVPGVAADERHVGRVDAEMARGKRVDARRRLVDAHVARPRGRVGRASLKPGGRDGGRDGRARPVRQDRPRSVGLEGRQRCRRRPDTRGSRR